MRWKLAITSSWRFLAVAIVVAFRFKFGTYVEVEMIYIFGGVPERTAFGRELECYL